ncbi:hypothetical protein ACHAP7_011569 [Fusarium lateritium]
MDAHRDSTPTTVGENVEGMAWASYPPLPEAVASGENSDFNIACDGQVYKLHQAIVCPQSRVIRAACSAMQGGASKTMHIRETNTFTIRCVINFLYFDEYEIETRWVEEEVPPAERDEDFAETENELAVKTLLTHLRIKLFAFHYEIGGLSEYSDKNIGHIFKSVPAYRLPAFIQRMNASTAGFPRHWASACNIGDRIQERIQDLSTVPDFSRLDVDKRIFLEIIKSCGQRMHFLEHAIDITKEMYLRLARELDDE